MRFKNIARFILIQSAIRIRGDIGFGQALIPPTVATANKPLDRVEDSPSIRFGGRLFRHASAHAGRPESGARANAARHTRAPTIAGARNTSDSLSARKEKPPRFPAPEARSRF